MAATTHVIEIETGIGEPAFIPLVRGKELAPISIGRKGMWTVDSARVLEVHAFVYFDGEQLFMQSADETTPMGARSPRPGHRSQRLVAWSWARRRWCSVRCWKGQRRRRHCPLRRPQTTFRDPSPRGVRWRRRPR
jgi:hypothetical protein